MDTGSASREAESHGSVETTAIAEAANRRRRLVLLIGRAAILLAVIVAALLMVGSSLGDLPRTESGSVDFTAVFDAARDSPWAVGLVTGSYVLLNFAGVPQFLLVGATVIVFGPWLGFLYAWGGTMVSSSVGFWLGHFFGGELLRRFGGDRANRLSERFASRGALAAAIVRVVPAGPAIVVNMAFGMSHVSFGKFLLGTGLGILPKVALIALVGKGVVGLLSGENLIMIGGITAAIVALIIALFVMKRVLRGWRSGEPAHQPRGFAPALAGDAGLAAQTSRPD